MAKKENKFVSEFRTTWQTAKREIGPEVSKEVDFSKGLGPAVDKIAKDWDKAADQEPVPEATKKALVKAVVEIQAILKKYHNQIVAGNQKLPQFGGQWFALEKALQHIDRSIVQDMDAIGVACEKIKDSEWASDSAFDRQGNHQFAVVGADAEALKKGFDSLASKVASLKIPLKTAEAEWKDFQKSLAKYAEACFPNVRNTSLAMGGGLGTLFSVYAVPAIRKLDDKKAAEAGVAIKKLQDEVEKYLKPYMPHATKFKTEVELHLVKPYLDQWKSLGGH